MKYSKTNYVYPIKQRVAKYILKGSQYFFPRIYESELSELHQLFTKLVPNSSFLNCIFLIIVTLLNTSIANLNWKYSNYTKKESGSTLKHKILYRALELALRLRLGTARVHPNLHQAKLRYFFFLITLIKIIIAPILWTYLKIVYKKTLLFEHICLYLKLNVRFYTYDLYFNRSKSN